MRYVIAIGGNALQKRSVLRKLSAELVVLHNRGNGVVITHGNGPQVGKLAMHEKKNWAQLTAETQVEMGMEIKKSLLQSAKKRKPEVAVVPTRVVVSGRDAEFTHPSKPVGRFYGAREAKIMEKRGFVMKHLLDGYRRVVPSPKPKRIVELESIRTLLMKGYIVIAGGGGGIAVTGARGDFKYADAVIDKDLTSALLAEKLKADKLIILTNVDGIYLDFETDKQRMLRRVNVSKLQMYAKKGEFEVGSMLPKVRACLDFVKKTSKPAVIGNLSNADKVFRAKEATTISK